MQQDKFTHIRELFNAVIQNYRDNWVAGPVVTIDEQLVGFRSRFPSEFIYQISLTSMESKSSWFVMLIANTV